MNKMIAFPMAFMGILVIFSVLFSNNMSTYYADSHAKNISDEVSSDSDAIIEIMGFSITSYHILLAIVTAAFIAAGAAGIHFLGSGANDFSQKLVFNASIYLVIWTAFTGLTFQWLFNSAISGMFWFGLTLIYVFGIASQVNQVSE